MPGVNEARQDKKGDSRNAFPNSGRKIQNDIIKSEDIRELKKKNSYRYYKNTKSMKQF
jgi:hypothetical protein